MKSIDFPKDTNYLLKQSVDTLKNKLSVINKGYIQDYDFEYIFEIAIKHSINDICCELENFTNVVSPEKTIQIVSYQKKWGNDEWNLNVQNKVKLNEEEKSTNRIVKYVQKLILEYTNHKDKLIKKDKHKHKYLNTMKKLNMLYESFNTLDKIINKAIESND